MRGRRALNGWLLAEAISLTGTRLSMVALPWFVLTTTGSATRTGLVAFFELAPLVLVKVLGGPVIDRIGARRVSIAADLGSVGVVGAVPVLHALGLLGFPVLLALVALAGALRGPGDAAKHALIPRLAADAGVPMERVTGLAGTVERTAGFLGAAAAGVLVAWLGPVPTLVVDALSFAASGALLALFLPRTTAPAREPSPYLRDLAEGWRFLRREPVLVGITAMVAVTNLLDMAYLTVLLPVWARQSGGGAGAVGLLLATFAAASIVGSALAARWGAALPRFRTFFLGFLFCGAPRLFVLAVDAPAVAVLAVVALGGFSSGFLNPVLGAVIYERIPQPLVGRVSSMSTAACWALMPLGGVVAGALVAGVGLTWALTACGVAYLVVTLLPAVAGPFRAMDERREPVGVT